MLKHLVNQAHKDGMVPHKNRLDGYRVGFMLRDALYQFEPNWMFIKPDTYFYGNLLFGADEFIYYDLDEVKKVIGRDKYLRIYVILIRDIYSSLKLDDRINIVYEEPYEEVIKSVLKREEKLRINRERIQQELNNKRKLEYQFN